MNDYNQEKTKLVNSVFTKVYKKVRVAIFSTGDEIQEPGKKLKFG